MNILLLLIPLSLVLIGVAIWAFVWAVRRGQFEDLDAAALDVLVDERPVADERQVANAGRVHAAREDRKEPRP